MVYDVIAIPKLNEQSEKKICEAPIAYSPQDTAHIAHSTFGILPNLFLLLFRFFAINAHNTRTFC